MIFSKFATWQSNLFHNKGKLEKIAKAANHKLPGKSSLNVSFVPSRPVPSRPVLSCTVLSCPVQRDRGDHDEHGNNEEVGSYMRKLEVAHKEVEGYLISYNLRLACERKLEVI